MIDKPKDKLIAVNVQEEISTYLSLYCSYKKINKTDIVRSLLKDWYLDCVKEKQLDWLVKEITESLQLEWNRIKSKSKNTEFPVNLFEIWKDKAENQLRKKKIPPFYIDEIIKKINK